MWFVWMALTAQAEAGDDVSDGLTVGGATLAGQLVLGAAGGVAGFMAGDRVCDRSQAPHCMAPLLAFPAAGLGMAIGAPIGAGVGSAVVDRRPWRSVGLVAATQGAGLLVTAGGAVLAASGAGDTADQLGVGLIVTGLVGGFVVGPAIAGGYGGATSEHRVHVTVVPELGADRQGVRLAATF